MASTETWNAWWAYEADCKARGAYYTLTVRGQALTCAFPYAHLDEFKAAVPASERWWRPELKSWEVTLTGAYALIETHADKITPLTLATIEWLWP